MVNLSEAQIIGIVSIGLILSSAVAINYMEKSFYCQTEDNVKECIKLSSTGVTCYYTTGSDRCTGGKWEPLENYIKQKQEISKASWYTRDPDGKTCYEKGDLRKASKC